MRLEGKVALISGAASGMGAATARRFAREGAKVMIADMLDQEGQAVADGIVKANGAAVFQHLDVTDEASWRDAVGAAVARFGKLDILVNNAGISGSAEADTLDTEAWDRLMAVNGRGVFLGTKFAVPEMQKAGGGSIINLSSISGVVGQDGIHVAYNASKGAVRLLTKSVALHCAHRKYGIRCNSVHPTFIETPMVEGMLQATRDPAQTLATLIGSIPIGRLGRAEEVADLLLYLVSDESQFCTGAEFVIDGGLTAS